MHQRMFTAGLALAIGCATPTVIQAAHQAATAQAQRQADDQSRERLQLARELPANPPDAAGAFVDLLAQGGPFASQQACLLFSDSAAAQFAAANRAAN
jgi:guanyl-specific ribonuclease Sa